MSNPCPKSLESLAKLLDLPDSDYWSDFGCCEARKLLDQGGLSLIQTIKTNVESWSSHRLEHLAYILGESGEKIELELLEILMANPSAEASFRAREVFGSAVHQDT
jgi:hypothetical protein